MRTGNGEDMATIRADRKGAHERLYRANRKRVLMRDSVCALCGRPVDMELKAPDPMSPTVDHIIPVSKGGHPSDMNNLQLTHWICNRMKSDKLIQDRRIEVDPNGRIKNSCDWKKF